MKRKILTVTACILITAAVSAQSHHTDRKPPSPEMIIQKFDQNEDGKLTKEESKEAKFYKAFDKIDKNDDGYITKEEFSVFFEERHNEKKQK
jgi:Ca2+-binding EF-hand superfamily protein